MIQSNTKSGTKAHTCWVISVVLYIALIVCISLEHWVLSPPAVDSPLLIWCFRMFPLLAFIPVIIKADAKGFAWLGFVILFYFTSGVVTGWVKSDWMGWLQAVVSLVLFSSTILFVRWFYKRQ